MTAGLEIRRGSPEGESADRLLRRYYAELDERFAGGFQLEQTAAPASELVAPEGTFLVAYLDGVPVGCGALRRLDASVAEVKRMWVDPAARGRGIGRSLLAALESAAVELGYKRVRLDTSADLFEAISLYRSSGYAEIPAYNDNLYAGHWFEKSLAPEAHRQGE